MIIAYYILAILMVVVLIYHILDWYITGKYGESAVIYNGYADIINKHKHLVKAKDYEHLRNQSINISYDITMKGISFRKIIKATKHINKQIKWIEKNLTYVDYFKLKKREETFKELGI